MKARHPEATKTKGRKEATAARRRGSSAADLQKHLDQRTRELAEARKDLEEALEQQAATSKVLQVITASPGELEPVFQAMLENATRICEAKYGTLFRFDGQTFQLAAGTDLPPPFAEFQRQRAPFRPDPGTQLDIVLQTKQVSQSADRRIEGTPGPSVSIGGARSQVAVPMLKDE